MMLLITTILCVGLTLATSPPQPSPEVEDTCAPPMWHGQLGDNWPLAGISQKAKPKFQLLVKKTAGARSVYKPGKWHAVTIFAKRPKKKTSKRIHGFILSQTTNDSSCGLGEFAKKKMQSTNATFRAECNDVILDGNTDLTIVKAIRWKAPKCGCVTISVEIRSADNMIYYDDVDGEVEARYRVLSKTVCPRARKAKA